jgi:hypothetical protein
LLVEFASAVDAVNCAIDMQRKVVVDLASLGDPRFVPCAVASAAWSYDR